MNVRVGTELTSLRAARRLKAEGAEGVTVNAVHPGVVRTDIPRYMALPVRLVVYLFSYIAGKVS